MPAGWAGVVADGPLLGAPAVHAGEWGRMARAGVGFVRTAFAWPALEPQPGAYDLRATDRVVLAAARRGMWVLPVVSGTPAWAAAPPPGRYAELLRVLNARYGPAGTLWAEHRAAPREPVRRWQVWNEPSLRGYWPQRPWAPGYVALLRAAHAVLPGRIVLAGLPNRSWVALRAIYRAGGRGTFDAVALHPYTGRVANVLRLVRLARREMRRGGDAPLPVWLTEVSWPASLRVTRVRPGGFEVTERGQARRLGETLRVLARARHRLRIAHVAWYAWLTVEGRALPVWAGYAGLRRQVGGRVRSARSLRVFARTLRALGAPNPRLRAPGR